MNQWMSRMASIYYFAQNILQSENDRNNVYTLLLRHIMESTAMGICLIEERALWSGKD
jgi:hypothetical protein